MPLPAAVSSSGSRYATRGNGCTSNCSSAIYVDGELSGTVTGRALEWLDDNTLAVQRFEANGSIFLHRPDGTLAYNVTWPASARPSTSLTTHTAVTTSLTDSARRRKQL